MEGFDATILNLEEINVLLVSDRIQIEGLDATIKTALFLC